MISSSSFANVNGSGSASANERCSPSRSCAWACRWHRATSSPPTSRVCRPGTRSASARRASRPLAAACDLMVAMNPQTWNAGRGLASTPGGYLFYDSTKPLPPSTASATTSRANRRAADRDVQPPNTSDRAPAAAVQEYHLCGRALAALLDMDVAAIETLLAEQFKGREKLISAQCRTRWHHWPRLRAGQPALPDRPAACKVRRADKVGDRISMSRATAPRQHSARSMAARRVCAWYPITPSSSLAEAFHGLLRALSGSIPRPARSNATVLCRRKTRLSSIGMVDRRSLERRAGVHLRLPALASR